MALSEVQKYENREATYDGQREFSESLIGIIETIQNNAARTSADKTTLKKKYHTLRFVADGLMFHISDIEHFSGECDRDGETFKKLEELAQDYRNLGSRIEGVLAKAEGLVMALHKERFIKANGDSIQAAPNQVVISQPVATTPISKPNPHKGANPSPQSPNHQSKSSACQKKLMEKINLQLKETTTLREKLKELDLKVADSKSFKQEIILKDKVINEKDEINKNLKIQIEQLQLEKIEQNNTIKTLNEVI